MLRYARYHQRPVNHDIFMFQAGKIRIYTKYTWLSVVVLAKHLPYFQN